MFIIPRGLCLIIWEQAGVEKPSRVYNHFTAADRSPPHKREGIRSDGWKQLLPYGEIQPALEVTLKYFSQTYFSFGEKNVIKHRNEIIRRLERWLSHPEGWLLLLRTSVWFPAPMLGGSLTITCKPSTRGLMPFYGSFGHFNS